ncbi:hypothetical protein GUITHDRAFT_117517 [Guillardia theta CCMP2712]|uniref:Rhodanese domain-containing protein n=1 Tax=Guillardia theta (strain CCMP2712) TaxID=905079 RepID=L1IK63_GUITC|nr:hypothetical protein GUITHDRAFT_117517 [Guillardia theta CCMP2712]EKX36289.1 hypothetical protein GUITHDRAFT_117517 [Guillardia theta CCMP2712]|eukprot:XP_005823269.1 hypothetical protein GUITHDRAFT_117517 [Guillardia theta CCMP2712]
MAMSAGGSSLEEDVIRARALVSTDWLQEHLEEVTILDIRGEVEKLPAEADFVQTVYRPCKEDFLNGHIPGAEFVDWTADIVDPQSLVPVQLSPKDLFEAAMEERGVCNDNTVVVYDNGNMLFATRLWWALTYYGHKDVRILNGGWKRWCAEERDISVDTECPLKKYAEFNARVELPSLRCVASDMREVIKKTSDACIVDARNAAQFTSKERRAKRSGCIPGATNIPYKRLINKEMGGYLRYCNGGVASTAVLFALWKLGIPLCNLSNYDGSWGEWGNQEDDELYPVART